MKKMDRIDRLIGIGVICLVIIAALIIGVRIWHKNRGNTSIETAEELSAKTVAENTINTAGVPAPPVVIDSEKLGENSETSALMQQRKEEIGIYNGIDIVAKPDEMIKIGDATVSMQKILDQIRIQEGEIIEKDLAAVKTEPQGDVRETYKNIGRKSPIQKDEVYGIHIVRPGDNIWNIHFTFLQSYFDHRGIRLSPASDEPDKRGVSSGVGKLLKFSEKMVYIYNLRLNKIETDLDLIHPLSKIVVFRMKQVFSLLNQIDSARINLIHFDGETLWMPAG